MTDTITRLQRVLKKADERIKKANERNKRTKKGGSVHPTLAEEIARIALNRNDPEAALQEAASQTTSQDQLRRAVAYVAGRLLRDKDQPPLYPGA